MNLITPQSDELDISKLPQRTNFIEKVVFLDGLTGTGKTMMGPILGSFQRVELGRLEHIYEYLCGLDFLGKMDVDAVDFMLSMYGNMAIYDTLISREVNFRWNDLTSVFKNPNTWTYLKRIFCSDGDVVLDRIKKEKPVLQLICHQALGIMAPTFRTFKDKMCVIEMVRHPLYLLEHWYTYIDRHGKDVRDFTICFEYQGESLPWFAKGWERKYVKSHSMDKVIFSIEWLLKRVDIVVESLTPEQREQILFIPFEHFVLNPLPYIEKIGRLLGTCAGAKTKKVLKTQKCPRIQVAAGPNKEIYRRYGWKKPSIHSSDKKELKNKKDSILSMVSKEALDVLDRLSFDYEDKYGLWF